MITVRSSHGSHISKMIIVVLCVYKYKYTALFKKVGILLCFLQDGMGKCSLIQKNIFLGAQLLLVNSLLVSRTSKVQNLCLVSCCSGMRGKSGFSVRSFRVTSG